MVEITVQFEHDTEPVSLENEPAAHDEHDDAPSPEYSPACGWWLGSKLTRFAESRRR